MGTTYEIQETEFLHECFTTSIPIASIEGIKYHRLMLYPFFTPAHSNVLQSCKTIADLKDTWEHDIALVLVLVAKLLSVRALLVVAPLTHPRATPDDEDDNRPVAAGNDNSQPRDDLEHVVRARYNIESDSMGDPSLSRTRRTQIRQVLVDQSVASLSKQEDQASNSVNRRLVCRRSQRVGLVDEVRAQQA